MTSINYYIIIIYVSLITILIIVSSLYIDYYHYTISNDCPIHSVTTGLPSHPIDLVWRHLGTVGRKSTDREWRVFQEDSIWRWIKTYKKLWKMDEHRIKRAQLQSIYWMMYLQCTYI